MTESHFLLIYGLLLIIYAEQQDKGVFQCVFGALGVISYLLYFLSTDFVRGFIVGLMQH